MRGKEGISAPHFETRWKSSGEVNELSGDELHVLELDTRRLHGLLELRVFAVRGKLEKHHEVLPEHVGEDQRFPHLAAAQELNDRGRDGPSPSPLMGKRQQRDPVLPKPVHEPELIDVQDVGRHLLRRDLELRVLHLRHDVLPGFCS